MLRRHSLRRLLTAGAVVALGVTASELAGAWNATSGHPRIAGTRVTGAAPNARAYTQATAGVDVAAKPSARLLREFAVFRRAVTERAGAKGHEADAAIAASPPPMINDIGANYASRSGTDLGINPALATYVQVNSVYGIWVVPGAAGACMVSRGPQGQYFGSCGTTQEMAAGQMVDTRTTTAGGAESLWGFAPDGVSNVAAVGGGPCKRR